MADIQELLSSISDEDMAKIKSMAESLMGGAGKTDTEPTPVKNSLPFDDKTISKIMSIMGKMNKEDYRTRLISDLKPLLSTERQKKADDAIRFLQIIEMMPALKEIM